MKLPSHLLATATAVVLAITACDTAPVIMTSQHESHGPRPVRLPAEIRSRLESRFDVAAVEELLGMMAPEEQHEFLESIGATATPPANGETKTVVVFSRSTDPLRQALLDRMWAPFWDHLPPEFLDRTDLPYPGRELAKARRAAITRDRKPGSGQ